MIVNRPFIIGIIGAVGGVIVAVAIGLTFFLEPPPDADRSALAPPEIKRDVAPAPIAKRVAPSQPVTGIESSAPELVAPAITKQPVRPKFDVVRVNPRGDTVIAGRAEPNVEVTVTDRNREIGKVKADSRGEWVLVPKKSLSAGAHELALAAKKSESSPEILSKEKVIIVVPKQGENITGQKGDSGSLALAVPRNDDGPATVLQKPGGASRAPVVVERSPQELATAKQALRAEAEAAVEAEVVARIAPAAGGGAAKSEASKSGLSLDAIDYDSAGKVAMSGSAPEGARVHVYLDNNLVGDATAEKSGVWRLKPSDPVSPGLYKMRVDQVNKTGQVVARVEMPFSRAKPLMGLPSDTVIFVQPGNNLWRIARNTYGRGLRFTVIYEANRDQIRNPDLIYPGQIFVLPRVN